MTAPASLANSQHWPCGTPRSQNNAFSATPRSIKPAQEPAPRKAKPTKSAQVAISLETPEERKARQVRDRMMKAANRVNQPNFHIETLAQSIANKDKQSRLIGKRNGARSA